ncbi:glycosyl hydrolase 108 family protein [Novacetimonas hansenii]|uniref:glycosyl hydrolase 108 family protein n=1 Tax=Novacetimonas hansenii TaxID=436 RepID=UPI00094FCF84|nr:glycosyl hydrolase 108 family protein [Novacetimonas hansenii]
MPKTDLDFCADFTLNEEGGYQKCSSDPGNWTGGEIGHGILIGTNMGISAPCLRGWLNRVPTEADMRGLTEVTFSQIYADLFWTPCGGAELPSGINLMVVDEAFNTGEETSLRLLDEVRSSLTPTRLIAPLFAMRLQGSLGVPADGIIGPVTLDAIATADALDLVQICALGSLQDNVYRRDAGFTEFGTDWLGRTARRVTSAFQLSNAARKAAS